MDQCHRPRVVRDSPVTKNADYEFWMGISISCRVFKVSVRSSQLQKCLDLWVWIGDTGSGGLCCTKPRQTISRSRNRSQTPGGHASPFHLGSWPARPRVHISAPTFTDFSVEFESAISYDSGYAFPFTSLRAQPLRCVRPSATPWTVAYRAPMSMEFSRQEYWSGLPCALPRDLPNPGIESASPALPALAGRLFTTAPPAVLPSITFFSLNLFCIFFFSSDLWNTGAIRPSLRTLLPLYMLSLVMCPCFCGSSALGDSGHGSWTRFSGFNSESVTLLAFFPHL